MTKTEAQTIIIGMEDGWLKGNQKEYDEAKQYIIEHIDELILEEKLYK